MPILKKPPHHDAPSEYADLSCEGCALFCHAESLRAAESMDGGAGFSLPDGTGSNGVMILLEALGKEEALSGKPAMGRAGAQLNRALYRLKVPRSGFVIDNVAKCRPPRNWFGPDAPWYESAVAHCDQYFRRNLDVYKPRVILPMGNVPLQKLLNLTGIIDRNHPKRGYVYPLDLQGEKMMHQVHVVPTIHPSYVMRGMQHLAQVFCNDIERALTVSKHGWPTYTPNYIEHPTDDTVYKFLQEAKAECAAGGWIAADIETPWSKGKTEEEQTHGMDEIDRISFSFRGGYAITMEWDRWRGSIQEILGLPWKGTCFWNADFDVPRIHAAGVRLGGVVIDAMWMWHFLQPALPKGLAFVAPFYTPLSEWKSANDAFPEYYSCCDSDATIICARGIQRDLQTEGRWEAYLNHTHRLLPRLGAMGDSGILVDSKAKRGLHETLSRETQEILDEINTLVPEEVKPQTIRTKFTITVTCPRCRGEGLQPDRPKGVTFKDYEEGTADPERYLPESPCNKCKGSGRVGMDIRVGMDEAPDVAEAEGFRIDGDYFVRTEMFSPLSPKQVRDYILHIGHPIGRNWKTGGDTTHEAHIRRLAARFTGNRVYPLILLYRKKMRLLSNYVEGYGPGEDGYMRTEFNLMPSTGRLASRNPNVQNIPKRPNLEVTKEVLAKVRSQFIASPGHALVEIDYNAIEAVLVGFYARDEDYIRASKLGIHGIFASYLLVERGDWKEPISLDWDDEDIRAAVHDVKENHVEIYSAAKMGDLASNYLCAPKRLRMEYPEYYPSMKFARWLQDVYFNTLARQVRVWQKDTLRRAASVHYLENVYKYRHYFWDVVSARGKLGDHAKDAIAFLPQSTAAGKIKMDILHMADEYFRYLKWQIHDALLWDVPKKELDVFIPAMVEYMTAPVPELGGLELGVEVAVGQNWGEMKEVK